MLSLDLQRGDIGGFQTITWIKRKAALQRHQQRIPVFEHQKRGALRRVFPDQMIGLVAMIRRQADVKGAGLPLMLPPQPKPQRLALKGKGDVKTRRSAGQSGRVRWLVYSERNRGKNIVMQ